MHDRFPVCYTMPGISNYMPGVSLSTFSSILHLPIPFPPSTGCLLLNFIILLLEMCLTLLIGQQLLYNRCLTVLLVDSRTKVLCWGFYYRPHLAQSDTVRKNEKSLGT
jgi:hypothetical protein